MLAGRARSRARPPIEFGRTFPIGQDWSDSGGLSFWYYGQNSGKNIQVTLANNQAAASDPSKWKLVWSDEFNGTAGTAPNASVWGNEVGDGTVNGIPGWGNDELEYYTAGTDQRRHRRPGQPGDHHQGGRRLAACATTARASTPRRAC